MLWIIRCWRGGGRVGRDSLITTTASPPPLLSSALIHCPNIFPRGHSHSNISNTSPFDRQSKGFQLWKYLIEKAGNSVAWFVDIWKFIGICLNRSEVVQMRGKNWKRSRIPSQESLTQFFCVPVKLLSCWCFLFPRSGDSPPFLIAVRDWWANMSLWRLMKEGGQGRMVGHRHRHDGGRFLVWFLVTYIWCLLFNGK